MIGEVNLFPCLGSSIQRLRKQIQCYLVNEIAHTSSLFPRLYDFQPAFDRVSDSSIERTARSPSQARFLSMLKGSRLRESLRATFFIIFTYSSFSVRSEEASDVVVLDADNFDSLTKTGSWMLEFYAPWCKFCKDLAPIYKQLATAHKGVVSFGTVDCTVHQTLCQRFQVKGYPTVKFAHNGALYDYQGERKFDALTEFALEGYKSATPAGSLEPAKGGGVVELNDSNFSETDDGTRWMVMFYAPWCGYCKKYMPQFEALAPTFKGTVNFGKVNCEATPSICELYSIPGYPTLKHIEAGGYRDYNGEASDTNIKTYLTAGYLNSPIHPKPWHPIFSMVHTAITEFVYVFLAVAFLFGLAMGYIFFGGAIPAADNVQNTFIPKPDKQD
eukprot:gene9179-10770_t